MKKIPLWAQAVIVIILVMLGILSKPFLEKNDANQFAERFLDLHVAGDYPAALDMYAEPNNALALESILTYDIISREPISEEEFRFEIELQNNSQFFAEENRWELIIRENYNIWKVTDFRPL